MGMAGVARFLEAMVILARLVCDHKIFSHSSLIYM